MGSVGLGSVIFAFAGLGWVLSSQFLGSGFLEPGLGFSRAWAFLDWDGFWLGLEFFWLYWVLVGLGIFLAGLGFGWAWNFFGWIGFWLGL